MLSLAIVAYTLLLFILARMFALLVQKNERIEQLEAALKAARSELNKRELYPNNNHSRR